MTAATDKPEGRPFGRMRVRREVMGSRPKAIVTRHGDKAARQLGRRPIISED